MAEAKMTEAEVQARRARDRARLRRVAVRHGAAFLAAMTLWGAADLWASESGLALAQLVAALNAVLAGAAMCFLVHEWGHFAAARLAGAVSPVLKEPSSFFMFSFKQEASSRRQFLGMSLGGPTANWLFAGLLFLLLPLSTAPQVILLATSVGVAVNVSVFELPIIAKVSRGADAEDAIQRRLAEVGMSGRAAGLAAGGLAFAALI